jgi:hypothetical protein
MSYATMPTFEGTSIGIRRLSTLGNAGHMLGGLGDITGDSAAAVAAEILDQGTANFLIAAGATDQDFINLLNGTTDVATLMTRYTTGAAGTTIPGTPLVAPLTPVAPGSPGTAAATGINPTVAPPPPSGGINPALAPTPPAPSPTPGAINYAVPAVQVPAGSILSYTASWNNPSALANSYAGVVPKLVSQLPSYGISVLQTNVTGLGLVGPSSIQLQLQSLGAHAQVSDVTSIVNSLLQALVGNTLFNSAPQMSLISAGPITPAGAVPPPGTQTMTQWFQSNWAYFAAFVAAVVILPPVIKKL